MRAGASIRSFLAELSPPPAQSRIARLFGISPLTKTSASLYRAALAEFLVAESVSALGDEWHVIHAIEVRDTDGNDERRDDVSHLLAGPEGVFAITTVNPSGEPVWVAASVFIQDGVRMPHLRDAEFNALRLSQHLFERGRIRVEVVPGVLVANPRGLIIDRAPQRVSVLTPGELAGWVRSFSATLSSSEIDTIVAAARSLQSPVADGHPAMSEAIERFRAVRGQLFRARRRRIIWVATALVAAWLLVVATMIGNAVFHDAGVL